MVKMPPDWNGLLCVESVEYVEDGRLVWSGGPYFNVLHKLGEQFILQVAFTATPKPANYYLGLDNRLTLSAADVIGDVSGEPTGSGYSRQGVSSSTGFSITPSGVSDGYKVLSSVVSFTAVGSSWGPVTNLFMTTTQDDAGVLIASIALETGFSVEPGGTVLMRMGLILRNP
jgi:hypothetical protein